MDNVRKITGAELPALLDMEKEHTKNTESLEDITKRFNENPDLFIGCFKEDTLIGEITGFVKDKKVMIKSISVDIKYRGQGIGQRILSFFESRVRKQGKKISVTCKNGYSQHFYMKHGFTPKILLLKIKKSNLPKNYKEQHTIKKEEQDKDTVLIYIKINALDDELMNMLKQKFNAHEAKFILEKEYLY